jgi:uncharacterized protein YfaS (alpha-2-macroglobulin family)
LLRAGDTLSMKLFVRRQTGDGFALPPRAALENRLTIRHVGTDRVYEIPVTWDGSQHGESTFTIPKDAALGTYQILVHDSLAERRQRTERMAGTFRIEQFRVPLMRGRMQQVGAPLVHATEVKVDLQVNYLSGGGAGGLPVRLRTQVEAKNVAFPDYDDFAFAKGNVKEGREERGDSFASSGGYDFVEPELADDDAERDPNASARNGVSELPLTLDASGGTRATIKNVAKADTARDMVAEMEYRDPNGETLTAAARIALWPSAIVLGIKPDGWAASKERLKFTVVAVDLRGQPVAGVAVKTDAFQREYYSHRRRLIGGFYAFDQGSETKRVRLVRRHDRRARRADLRDEACRTRQPDPARQCHRQPGHAHRHAHRRLGRERRRRLVRWLGQRSHRSAARKEAL